MEIKIKLEGKIVELETGTYCVQKVAYGIALVKITDKDQYDFSDIAPRTMEIVRPGQEGYFEA